MSNYYDKIYESEAYSVEQAILAEDTIFTVVKDLDAKFFLKILTPMIKSEDVNTKNMKGVTSANYITLTIPSYLLFPFMNIQPSTIKVPTLMDPDTGVPTKYKSYNVLTYTGSTVTTTKNSKTSKSSKSKKNTDDDSGTKSFTIPKGTIFFVEFLGGQADADKAYIVGISPFKYVGTGA